MKRDCQNYFVIIESMVGVHTTDKGAFHYVSTTGASSRSPMMHRGLGNLVRAAITTFLFLSFGSQASSSVDGRDQLVTDYVSHSSKIHIKTLLAISLYYYYIERERDRCFASRNTFQRHGGTGFHTSCEKHCILPAARNGLIFVIDGSSQ